MDLHIGHQTRQHKDVEIAIARSDQKKLLKLNAWQNIFYIEQGETKKWDGETLTLPVHEMHCTYNSGENIEILLDEFDDEFWYYRRDPKIKLSRSKFGKGSGAPLPLEILLLYKSKAPREVDELDFQNALPHLNQDQKEWLHNALSDTGHPWLQSLKTLGSNYP